ncbi:FAD-binding domain-containing protein [Thelephora ganbajun]|uniref:FAD-binding domain-containing protein n=1 Tax=Thelephora ganbajun TaxID=370292 RepID=A0ACB6ZH66_THEGA|nr:FAD-binding domain-containing protein [Thelephora ganbajun]
MLSRFLTVSTLATLAFAATGSEYHAACEAVEATVSNASKVYYPGNLLYTKGIYHPTASSQESPACVVEPGTPEDVGRILNVINAMKTPFAVKSGGHTMNPGFSSTKGIHIYTGKFSQVTYDAASGTAVIGTGLIWDNVYQRLQEHHVNVVGGRVTGVGVGGLLLGGGYSYKTNQYGLSIDSIVGFNLVLPNGTVAYVTQSAHPDLFFGLKGGFNNFGIVTDFTMNTFPQTEVWGGQIMYPFTQFNEVRAAIADFSADSQDPKAAILPSYISYQGNHIINQGIFYDGPNPPPGTFDNFTNILSVSSDLKTRSYVDMILSSPANSTAGLRGSFQMLGVSHFSQTLLEAVEEELKYWTVKLTPKGGSFFSYSIEPFLPNYLSHPNSPSAFPTPAARNLGKAPNPLLISFGWIDSFYDDEFVGAVEESANRLAAMAEAEGLLSDHPLALYGNYVNSRTPLVDIYGDNLPRLRALRAEIDPEDVMGLSGGFRF